jgi:hypothetical protein
VVNVLKPGTYKLANEDGEELTNAWTHPTVTPLLPLERISKFFLLSTHPTPQLVVRM